MNLDIVELIRNTEKITVKKERKLFKKKGYIKVGIAKKIFPVIFQEILESNRYRKSRRK